MINMVCLELKSDSHGIIVTSQIILSTHVTMRVRMCEPPSHCLRALAVVTLSRVLCSPSSGSHGQHDGQCFSGGGEEVVQVQIQEKLEDGHQSRFGEERVDRESL